MRGTHEVSTSETHPLLGQFGLAHVYLLSRLTGLASTGSVDSASTNIPHVVRLSRSESLGFDLRNIDKTVYCLRYGTQHATVSSTG